MEDKGELFQGTADCESEVVATNTKCRCSNDEENQAQSQESKENNLPIRNEVIQNIFGTVDSGSKPSTIIGCHSIVKDEKQEPTQEKEANILRSVLSLVHDCQCSNENCYSSQCRKMKIIILHAKECKIINCLICKGVNDWSDCHSKDCQETKCPKPFCLFLKNFVQIKCDNVQVGVEFPLVMSNAGPSTSDAMVAPCNDSNDTMFIHSFIDDLFVGEQKQLNAKGSSRKAAIQKCVQSVEHASKSTDADCQKQTNPTETRELAIGRCVLALEHACRCKDDNCRFSGCRKMKFIVSRSEACKRMGNGSCAICKRLIAVACYHVKNCQETICPVPFCLNIKNKLKRQQTAQIQVLKRRIEAMLNRSPTETIRQSSPGSSNQPSPDDKPLTSPHGPQPGIELKPSACPPVAALQAARQTSPHMVGPGNFGNDAMVNNPIVNLVASVEHASEQQRMQKPMPHMLHGQQNQMMEMRNTSNWDNSIFNQNMQPHGAPQSGQPVGLRPPSQMIGANNMPNPADPAPELSQVMSNPGMSPSAGMPPSLYAQVLQQLRTYPKSSNFSQIKQQVLHILKSDPQLMAVFVEQRQGQPQQQQQLPQQPPPQQAMTGQPLPQPCTWQQHQQELLAMQQQQQQGQSNQFHVHPVAPDAAAVPEQQLPAEAECPTTKSSK